MNKGLTLSELHSSGAMTAFIPRLSLEPLEVFVAQRVVEDEHLIVRYLSVYLEDGTLGNLISPNKLTGARFFPKSNQNQTKMKPESNITNVPFLPQKEKLNFMKTKEQPTMHRAMN